MKLSKIKHGSKLMGYIGGPCRPKLAPFMGSSHLRKRVKLCISRALSQVLANGRMPNASPHCRGPFACYFLLKKNGILAY